MSNDILYFQNFDELFPYDVIFLVMCLKTPSTSPDESSDHILSGASDIVFKAHTI